MKAILFNEHGPAANLYIGEAPDPVLEPGEILIRTKATSLNRADILQREGKYPPPQGTSEILGLDVSGVVERISEGVSDFKVGDRVMALLPGGGYAELAKAHQSCAMIIPDSLSFEQAAAVPEVFLTAYQALFLVGDLAQGQTVLIHAAASGVGTAAIQLARLQNASTIIATAGSEQKCEFCLDLGATDAVNYKEINFFDVVVQATQNYGADLILDFIGAPYFEANCLSLAVDGRIVSIAMMGGTKVDKANLAPLLFKRGAFIGTTLRSRTLSYKAQLVELFTTNALPYFASGQLKPIIDSVYPWDKVQDAQGHMESNNNMGKIVLTIT
ncbi:MAG: NAD(P)H-quinone oxidoreductase [Deltaproteobacteria bacterium]|nr:NAD(P)H-quinone oxidoreductase [Deltaproteobacteria bacterium]